MTAVFLFSMGFWRSKGARAEEVVPLLIALMALFATGRSAHFLVASRAGLVVGALEPGYVVVVGGPALFPQGCCGERLGQMATPAGHACGRAAVLVASHAIGILSEGAGRMVMAIGAVFDEHDMLGMVEFYFIIQVYQDIELQGIRRGFGIGVGREREQGQHEKSPD